MVTATAPATRIAGMWHRAVAAWRRGLTSLRSLARRQAAPARASRRLRPVVVPVSLDDLRGPASGVVELPVRLYWSGSRQFDLADPHQVAGMCEAVIDAAVTIDDVARYLNTDLLARVWPVLGMSRLKRDAWENRFPVLRRQRLAAAA
jgi:hypothetical protein